MRPSGCRDDEDGPFFKHFPPKCKFSFDIESENGYYTVDMRSHGPSTAAAMTCLWERMQANAW